MKFSIYLLTQPYHGDKNFGLLFEKWCPLMVLGESTLEEEKDMLQDNQVMPMLAVKDVARLLHIHVNTVRRWSDNGIIRAYRITRRGDRRFRQEDIARFLAELNDFNSYKGNGRKTATLTADRV